MSCRAGSGGLQLDPNGDAAPAGVEGDHPDLRERRPLTDDIHFWGGIRQVAAFGYPLFTVSMNALPPVPSLAGERWHDQWLRRIDELVP